MNSKTIGDKSASKIMAILLDKNYSVLIPFGDNQRYDLVVDFFGKFIKIQCKTGRLRNGAIKANAYSVYKLKGAYIKRKYTKNEIDCFMIYCEEVNKIYCVYLKEIKTDEIVLRYTNAKNFQNNRYLFAKNYEFNSFIKNTK